MTVMYSLKYTYLKSFTIEGKFLPERINFIDLMTCYHLVMGFRVVLHQTFTSFSQTIAIDINKYTNVIRSRKRGISSNKYFLLPPDILKI